jgi:tetratricopeptide (TPR) repeat protein
MFLKAQAFKLECHLRGSDQMIRISGILYLLSTLMFINACSTTQQQSEQNLNSSELFKLVEEAGESYKMGLLTDAEIKYREISSKYPRYYDAWLKLGNIYVRTDQLEAAIRVYLKCTEVEPEAMQGWNNLALARLKQAMNALKEGRNNMTKGSIQYKELDDFYKGLATVIAIK